MIEGRVVVVDENDGSATASATPHVVELRAGQQMTTGTAAAPEITPVNLQHVTAWTVGFTTPAQKYLAVIQGVDANPSWTADQVRDARAGAVITIGGVQWTSYDRRDSDDPGNVAYALVTEADGSTIVLAGTAGDEEFAALAAAVAKELS